jgi:ribosomal peptide maturation radical SAM protein 1
MPFHGLASPSLGLSLLKAELIGAGVPCSVRYLTLDFAARIGVDCYDWICRDTAGTFVGEWIFSHCLAPQLSRRAEEYVEEILIPTHRMSTARLEELLAACDLAQSFLDDALLGTDWGGYDVVGFTTTFQQNTASLAFARMLKVAHPRLRIAFGGGNCEGEMGVQLHRSFPWVDYVCLGEGDGVFTRLVLQLQGTASAQLLPGIVGPADRASLRSVAPAPPVSDLDALPVPDFDDYFDQVGASPIQAGVSPRLELETSRGCWWGAKHHCTFCGLNDFTLGFRSKTQARALSEIRSVAARYAAHLGPRPLICFTDNILDLSYFDILLPALKESRLNLAFFYETKANLTKAQVRLLAEAGVDRIQPGIESLSTAILRLMKKGCTALQNIQLLKWCKEFGIHADWNILYGFPGEDPKEFEHQREMVGRITHLEPPVGTGPVRLDRFSPYFVQAVAYGLKNVRPKKPLGYIYSLPADDLFRLSYHFDFDYPDGRRPDDYAAALTETVDRWRDGASGEFCYMLGWGDRLILWDGRGKRAPSHLVLDGERKALYEYCDAVRPFKSIGAHMNSVFGLPEEETRRILDEFVGSGLVLADEGHYLSLAVGFHDRGLSGAGPATATRQDPAPALGTGGAGDLFTDRFLRKNVSVRTLEVEDGLLLLVPTTRRLCRLNDSAAAIWDLLDDLHQVDAIVRTVFAALPGHVAEIREDTLATVGELLRNGMIEIG